MTASNGPSKGNPASKSCGDECDALIAGEAICGRGEHWGRHVDEGRHRLRVRVEHECSEAPVATAEIEDAAGSAPVEVADQNRFALSAVWQSVGAGEVVRGLLGRIPRVRHRGSMHSEIRRGDIVSADRRSLRDARAGGRLDIGPKSTGGNPMLHRSPLTVANRASSPAMVMMITGSATASTAASSDYAVGDCYSTGDFDHDEISLSSKVPCTSTHAMQIIVGSPIPKKLLAAGYARLRDSVVEDLTKHSTSTPGTPPAPPRRWPRPSMPTRVPRSARALTKNKSLEFLPGYPGSGRMGPAGSGGVQLRRQGLTCSASSVPDRRTRPRRVSATSAIWGRRTHSANSGCA